MGESGLAGERVVRRRVRSFCYGRYDRVPADPDPPLVGGGTVAVTGTTSRTAQPTGGRGALANPAPCGWGT